MVTAARLYVRPDEAPATAQTGATPARYGRPDLTDAQATRPAVPAANDHARGGHRDGRGAWDRGAGQHGL